MSTELSQQTPFAQTWQARILPRAPLIAPARQFVFPQFVPGEEDAMNRGALLLEVKPRTGGLFLATCALGFRDPALPTGLWALPSPDDLLAVAGGYAYLLPTCAPEGARLLEQRPVASILSAPDEGLVLLAGFHDVLAVDARGVRWRSGRLSWEGVTLGNVQNGTLHGQGWDMFTDREVPFTVDLRTGQHTGGGYATTTPRA